MTLQEFLGSAICDLNFPPNWMSFQSEIHCKMAIFNPKSHAPETSEGSESASILLVRIFFISQATFPSFDILSLALAERGFRGGLGCAIKAIRQNRVLHVLYIP